MAWDDIARQDHRRVCARYPSDMTDREWAIIAPLLPPARAGGRPRTVDLRAVVDAILFIASSGCQWRMLPKDFPPRSTGQGGRCRRLAKDWEKTIESSSAWALVASIRLLSTAWNLDERLGGPVSCGETDGVFPCRLRIRHGARPCPPAPATPTPLRPTSARSVPARTCRATACACS